MGNWWLSGLVEVSSISGAENSKSKLRQNLELAFVKPVSGSGLRLSVSKPLFMLYCSMLQLIAINVNPSLMANSALIRVLKITDSSTCCQYFVVYFSGYLWTLLAPWKQAFTYSLFLIWCDTQTHATSQQQQQKQQQGNNKADSDLLAEIPYNRIYIRLYCCWAYW